MKPEPWFAAWVGSIASGLIYYRQGGGHSMTWIGRQYLQRYPWFGGAPLEKPSAAGAKAFESLVLSNRLGFAFRSKSWETLRRKAGRGKPWDLLLWATACYLDRRFSEAVRLCRKIQEQRPSWFWPRLLEADAAYFGADFERSDRLFREAVRQFPEAAWAHALFGRALYLNGDEKMFSCLDRAIALEPGSGWIHAWRAAAQGLAGRRKLSLQDYDRAVELSPEYERGRSWRGALWVSVQAPERAARELAAAARLNPFSEITRYAQARLELRRRDVSAAKRFLEKAILVNRTATWEKGWGDVHHADQALHASAKTIDEVLKHFPRWSTGRAWLGQTRMLLRDFKGAREALAKARSAGPGSPWTWVWSGELERRAGRFDAARDFFQEAARRGPKLAWAWAGLGKALCDCGALEKGERYLRRAIALDPKGGRGLFFAWLGERFWLSGQKQKASRYWEGALSWHPGWSWIARRLGRAPEESRKKLGRSKDAHAEGHDLETWARRSRVELNRSEPEVARWCASAALEEGHDPTHREALLLRSACAEQLGEGREAFRDLRRLVAWHPGDVAAKKVLDRITLESLLSGFPSNPMADLWRGLWIHGIFQNEQGRGAVSKSEDLIRIGRRHFRDFAWPDPSIRTWSAMDRDDVRRAGPAWRFLMDRWERPGKARPMRSLRGDIDDALRRDPKNAALLSLKALLNFEVDAPFLSLSKDGREAARRAGALDPALHWPKVWLGLGDFFAQDLESALRCFETVLASRPSWSLAWVLRGIVRWYHADARGSIDDFKNALRLDPRNAWAWILLGRSKADVPGESAMRGADKDLDRAAALEPSGFVLAWRGAARLAQGRKREAQRDFDAAIRVWPRYDRARAWRGVLHLQEGSNREARRDLQTALRQNPDYPTAHYALARACLRNGLWKRAQKAMQAGGERDRLYLWEWGWFDVEHPNPACRRALEDLSALLEKFPDWTWGWAWRGQSRLLLKDYRGAQADLRQALARNPRERWARLWLAEALRRIGRIPEALALLGKRKPFSSEPWVLASRGACLLHLGRYPESRNMLEKALRSNPRTGRGLAHAWLAETLWRSGFWDEAELSLREALKFYPHWQWARVWLKRLRSRESGPCLSRSRVARASENPSVFDVPGLLARALKRLKSGDYPGCVDDASRVLEMSLDPVNEKALWVRARAHEAMGKLEAAKADWRRRRALSPSRGSRR